MSRDRHLEWEGCFNARDLGGLPVAGDRCLRRGALVRADALDELTARGWAALAAHGVRTVVDLRNHDELPEVAPQRPTGVERVHLPLDGIEDEEFWAGYKGGWQFGTPLYYAAHVARFPRRSGAVVRAIAHAPPGGVVVHCGVGRDRTGLVVLLVLSLLGADEETIVADYLLSEPRLPPLFARRGEADHGPPIRAFLAERGTSVAGVVREAVREIDLGRWREEGEVDDATVAALARRSLTARST
jgi:protein-tyrosine phosphatase